MKKKITRAISVALVMLSVMVMCVVGVSAAETTQKGVNIHDDATISTTGIYSYTITFEEYNNLTDLAFVCFTSTKTIKEIDIIVTANDQSYRYRLYLPHSIDNGDSVWLAPKTGAYTLKFTDSTGTEITKEVAAPTHYAAWIANIVNSPECTVDGCGGAMTVEHFRPATCTESGYYYYTCDLCDGTETDRITVAKRAHYYENGACVHCNATASGSEHEHDYKYLPVGAETHIFGCTLCDYTYGDELEHNFNKEVVSVDSDAGTQYVKYTCWMCGYVTYKTEAKVCTTHVWSYEYYDAVNHTAVCTECLTVGTASPHTWNAGVITTQPTANSQGVRTYTCTVCNGTKTETIDYINLDTFCDGLTASQVLQVYERLFKDNSQYLLEHMDYNARFEKMSDAKAAQIFNDMFFFKDSTGKIKFQTKLIEDNKIGYWYDRYFATIIFPDLAKKGSASQYYKDFSAIYYDILEENPDNSLDYQQGYNDAISSVIEKNPVQGLFQGMWAGIVHFISIVGNGVTIGGITMMSVLISVAILVIAFFLAKLFKR